MNKRDELRNLRQFEQFSLYFSQAYISSLQKSNNFDFTRIPYSCRSVHFELPSFSCLILMINVDLKKSFYQRFTSGMRKMSSFNHHSTHSIGLIQTSFHGPNSSRRFIQRVFESHLYANTVLSICHGMKDMKFMKHSYYA